MRRHLVPGVTREEVRDRILANLRAPTPPARAAVPAPAPPRRRWSPRAALRTMRAALVWW